MKFQLDAPSSGECKQLVLLLHGYNLKKKAYDPIRSVIRKKLPDSCVLLPEMPLSAFSTANANTIVSDVLKLMDMQWATITASQERRPKVIIIGHSTGALIGKKVYICACGENSDAPFEKEIINKEQHEWAGDVERLVLLAGMSRGWTVNHHLNTKTAILIRMGATLGFFYRMIGITPLGFQTKRGAPFVTQIRLQWLSMLQAKKGEIGKALVVQLLGTIDDLIPPDDNVDLVTGSSFIYIDVRHSGHVDVLQMDDTPFGLERQNAFANALTSSAEILKQNHTTPADNSAIIVDEQVTDVVFVVHGIRDTGYWTQKIARRVKLLGNQKGLKFATETSTYGYFAMLPFLFYNKRREKVEWFMEQYTENKAAYPNARFSFVGHSNGTYLLAKALGEYPACRFRHVAFAGSVVNMHYDWKKLISTNRIERMYNIVAESDWVVAMFPRAFQELGIQDIGSAGYDGFNEEPTFQHKFVPGGHGAAVKERYWDHIAQFIVEGKASTPPVSIAKRGFVMSVLGALAPIPFIVLVIGLAALGYYLFGLSTNPYIKYGSTFGYVMALWRIVTRF